MERKQKMLSEKIHDMWLSFTLRQKIGCFAGTVILIVSVSIIFNAVLVNFVLDEFNTILDDNSRSHDFQEAMELEKNAFMEYVKNSSGENKSSYDIACVRTKRCLDALPFNYEVIGAGRYAKTWSIKNSYEVYTQQRDLVAVMDESSAHFVPELYKTYKMQDYLEIYAKNLVQLTLKEGNLAYQIKVPTLYRIPFVIGGVSLLLVGMILYLTWVMNQTFVSPVVKLANVSRKIARNDYSDEDVWVENKDEMGELVRAFNRMKHATESYITTLEEKNEMAKLLHEEELERVEMEKQLDAIKLELLKSQINPHFLFNTLNMIACMAKLEDADTTEQMITCMSNLFRYNLKTSEAVVPLEQELKVVRDYMYLQQMRFGSRIRYDIDCQTDGSSVMVPAFILQPIVENSIIHGLAKKEKGGSIYIRVWERDKKVTISVADTGLGMEEERLIQLREDLRRQATAKVGIGVGNIYKRIAAMYEDGDFRIYSKSGNGTVVQMVIPQER